MNNFNIECPYCGGHMALKEVPNMKSISYYCKDCIAVMHLSRYGEEYVKAFIDNIKKKRDKVE